MVLFRFWFQSFHFDAGSSSGSGAFILMQVPCPVPESLSKSDGKDCEHHENDGAQTFRAR